MSTVPNPMIGGVDVDAIIRAAALAAHPVGSYYWSSTATSPASLFGGAWTQISGQFVLAAGGGYNAGATGGAATHAHGAGSYMAEFEVTGGGNIIYRYVSSSRWTANYHLTLNGSAGSDTNSTSSAIQIIGTSAATNNMPPYIVAYCWRRTA